MRMLLRVQLPSALGCLGRGRSRPRWAARHRRSRPAFAMAGRAAGGRLPGDGKYRLVPRFPALDHHHHHAVRAGAAGDRDREVQCARPIRSRPARPTTPLLEMALDADPGDHPGGDRDPVVQLLFFQLNIPPPTSPSRRPATSGTGPTAIRTTRSSSTRSCCRTTSARSTRRSRACSRSTIRWWCRSTRSCASR